MVPIDTVLKTGDVCEIKTNKNASPSEDWLKFVKTASARNKIRQYISRAEAASKKDNIDAGRKMLRDEVRSRNLDEKVYCDGDTYKEYFGSFGARSFDEVLLLIGKKQITASQLIDKALPNKGGFLDSLAKMLRKNNNVQQQNQDKRSIGIGVQNVSGVKMVLSKCCNPIPGDDIVGFVSKGQGIKVHRKDCPNVANMAAGRLIDVYWDYPSITDKRYSADLELSGLDRPNLLSDVVTTLGSVKVNILNINAHVKDLDAIIKLTLSVENAEVLQRTIDNLNRVQGIAEVKRVIH